MMNEIEEWLRVNHRRLGDIALASETSPELVQLAAALVLAGFSDAEIYDRLLRLALSFGAGRRPAAGVPNALAQIRELGAQTKVT